MARRIRHGEVRWYTFRSPDKRRPVLILTRDSAIGYLTSLTVVPITTTIRNIPTEVFLSRDEDRMDQDCVINLDNIQTIPKIKLGSLIIRLSSVRMKEVDKAICFALGIKKLCATAFVLISTHSCT
jgi:mRNA interferase MazF